MQQHTFLNTVLIVNIFNPADSKGFVAFLLETSCALYEAVLEGLMRKSASAYAWNLSTVSHVDMETYKPIWFAKCTMPYVLVRPLGWLVFHTSPVHYLPET